LRGEVVDREQHARIVEEQLRQRARAGSGKTVDAITTDGRVSANTVRTHVRHVLAKTGCTRHAEVIALLSGILPSRCRRFMVWL